MKRIALTTALTLALAAPAVASPQLAASLGVDAGDYTVAQLIQLRDAKEADEFITVNFITGGGSEVVSTQSFGTAGADFALRVLEEGDDFIRARHARNSGSEVISTSAGVPDHVRIAQELLPRDNENE